MIAMYAALSTAVETLPEQNRSVVRRVFVARCDPLPENQALATQLWGELGLDVIPGLMEMVLEDVGHPVGKVNYFNLASEKCNNSVGNKGENIFIYFKSLTLTFNNIFLLQFGNLQYEDTNPKIIMYSKTSFNVCFKDF